jgi:antitoxin ParD1/3/4
MIAIKPKLGCRRSWIMNVSLTAHLEELIKKKVSSGLYNSASEVVREALRLLEEQDRLRELKIEELRREVRLGVEQLDRGKSAILDKSAVDRIKAKGRKMLNSRRRGKKDS